MCKEKYILRSLVIFSLILVASSDYSTSNSFSPVSITITIPSATVKRYIQPPWPWVVGHVALSIVMAIYGYIRTVLRPPGKTSLFTILLQYLNFFISLGGIAVLVRRLIINNISLPGLGVAIELGTLLIYNGYDVSQNEQSRASRILYKLFYVLSALTYNIGTVLYIVVGGLVVSNGQTNSVLLIINTGCDEACSNKFNNLRLYQGVGGDETCVVAWGISAGILGMLLVYFSFYACHSCRHRKIDFPNPERIKMYAILLVIAAGPFAITAAMSDRQAGEGTFNDCRGAELISTQDIFNVMVYSPCVYSSVVFSSSASGFWELWVKSKIAVLEGLVVW